MKINFLGDSITEGAWATSKDKRYSSLVCRMLGATENNYGIGGTRIAKQTSPETDRKEDGNDFFTRAQNMDKSADFVFVFGGTNDYGHGDAEIGTLEDEAQDTFYGALKRLVEYLLSTYGRERLCFILPLHRYHEDDPYGECGRKKKVGGALSAYVQAEIDVFKLYNVDYLDFRGVFPEPKVNTGDFLTHDGLHPNNEGHRLLAEKLTEYFHEKNQKLEA